MSLNPYINKTYIFCNFECPLFSVPYYIRTNCPACEAKASLDLLEQYEQAKFKKNWKKLIRGETNA